MADATLRLIFSAADETIGELDRLNQKGQLRRASHLRQLEATVARLDASAGTADDEQSLPRRDERGADRPVASEPDRTPFVALPQRTTHGGGWGPKMVEKLTAIALEKEARRW